VFIIVPWKIVDRPKRMPAVLRTVPAVEDDKTILLLL